ncbi:MAG: 6-bladed beta-propeller [Coriobacteriia bacterium]|nr:6-bladed beta-propeller [Coriobacteriia bacterium]
MASDDERIEPYADGEVAPVSEPVATATGYAARRRRRKLIILGILLLLLALLAYTVYYFDANRRLPLPQLVPASSGVTAPQYLYSITGVAPNALSAPIGVAVGRNGRVYVVDTRASVIKVFNTTGTFLYRFNAIADGKNTRLNSPAHIALDANDNVFVTDRRLMRLYMFDQNGKYLRSIVPDSDSNFVWSPLGITVDVNGDIYVTDVPSTTTHRILVLDKTGKIKTTFGKGGEVTDAKTGQGDFAFPNGLFVSSGTGDARDLYIADSNNRRIQVFSPSGTFKRLIISEGTPRGIVVDSRKQLYIVDVLSHQVDIFSTDGKHLTTFGSSGVGPGQFQYPEDIALDARGRIYISDRANDQVQVWGFPEAEIPGVTKVTPKQLPWCLAPLPLLLLPFLFRRRRFVVTPDFVEGMVVAERVPSMVSRRWRWIIPEEAHTPFVGRVVDGVDLGALIEPEPYSRSDATDLAAKLGIPLEKAGLLAMAKRYKTLCTEDPEVSRLAVLLGIDVYDRTTFLKRFVEGRRS